MLTDEQVHQGTDARTAVPALMEACGIAKRFGATEALNRVDLAINRGEIHALVGGNGAGKSTFVKILLGVIQPSAGTLRVEGRTVVMKSAGEAMAAGIYPIYQHLSQFPHLSVRENLAAFDLGTTRSLLVGPALPPDSRLRGWLATVGLNCDLDAPVSSLSIGEQQLLEIARAVAQEARVLVLDEPTAALTRTEAETLLATLRGLRAAGVGILFISHKLEEIIDIADRVSVIRDGRCAVSGAPMSSLGIKDLVIAMVGRDVPPIGEIERAADAIVLEARNLRTGADTTPMDFTVRAGEVVGLAGIVGCGAERIAAVLAGADGPAGGEVLVDGRPLRAGCRIDAVARGIGYVPPDRQSEGLFEVLKAATNASASRLKSLVRAGAIRHRRERQSALEILRSIALHPLDLDLEAARFSGGNQQKLVVARNLSITGLRLLVMAEPTRGVDVAARRAIHEAIWGAAAKGVAVVIASSDIDELIEIAHRILVVRRHSVRHSFARGARRSEVVAALTEPAS